MAAYQFPTNSYEDVRAAIGLDIDEVSLPDSVLSRGVYKGEAERFIMRNLTQAQYETAGNKDEVDYAASLYLAALVTPTLRIVQSEKIAGGNLTYANVNLSEIASGLETRALGRIADIQNPSGNAGQVGAVNPNYFGVAKARRRGLW